MPIKPSIRVRGDFAAVAEQKGFTTKTAIAKEIGVDASTLGRVMADKTKPSNEFIAGALALGAFVDLFEVR